MQAIRDIVESDRSEVEKLALAFRRITDGIIAETEREIEIARALSDEEGKIRAQIKMSTLKHAQQVLADCFAAITRRRPWNDQDNR